MNLGGKISYNDQQIARHFEQCGGSLSTPFPFYETQMFNLFLIQGSQPIII